MVLLSFNTVRMNGQTVRGLTVYFVDKYCKFTMNAVWHSSLHIIQTVDSIEWSDRLTPSYIIQSEQIITHIAAKR